MELSTAAVNVLLFFQNLGLPPFPAYLTVNKNQQLEMSEKPLNNSKSAKRLWKIISCASVQTFILTCWQLTSLFSNWNQFSDRMERMGIFIILLNISTICLTFYFTLNHYQLEHCFCFTQTVKLEKNNGVCQQFPGKLRQLLQSKMLIYTFSACIFAVPLAVTCLPFIFDYEPQQLFF